LTSLEEGTLKVSPSVMFARATRPVEDWVFMQGSKVGGSSGRTMRTLSAEEVDSPPATEQPLAARTVAAAAVSTTDKRLLLGWP
ncbi:hypothetical protein, partial [Escherichia coli]|uniref:hypothetical protein n=1 Tax=Escherichia coli TaxID=562 RepID=UPI0032E48C83